MIFSVAVPVLGQAAFLPTALASLMAQSCPFQLAVMDATPDDSVQRALNGYAAILHYARHGSDAGQSAAIQEGWDHTTGEILCWLCADDYLFPYAFMEAEKVFRERPDVDVVYGDGIYVNEAGDFLRYFPSISRDVSVIVKDNCICQPSCFVRRKAVEHVGKLDPKLHYIMDWDLWTRLFEAGAKFHYLCKPLSATRVYPGTKTTGDSKRRFAEIHRHLSQHTGYFSALRSMAGFYMAGARYPELEHSVESRHNAPLFDAFALLLRTKARLGSEKSTTEAKVLYGLDTRTNIVRGLCQVYLPIYRERAPSTVIVTTEGTCTLSASADRVSMSILSRQNDETQTRHIFEIPGPLRDSRHYFHLAFEAKEPASWKLLTVGLE